MDLTEVRMDNETKVNVAKKLYIGGFFFLPWMWLVNYLLFRKDLSNPRVPEDVKTYARRSLILFFVGFTLFVVWIAIYQASWRNWGLLGERITVIIPRGGKTLFKLKKTVTTQSGNVRPRAYTLYFLYLITYVHFQHKQGTHCPKYHSTCNAIYRVVFGGFLMELLYYLFGIILCFTLVGIPYALQIFRLGSYVRYPFGKRVVDVQSRSACMMVTLSAIWFILGGLPLAILHAVFGLIFFITIIGYSFGIQHFKLAALILYPFGREIVKDDSVQIVSANGYQNIP